MPHLSSYIRAIKPQQRLTRLQVRTDLSEFHVDRVASREKLLVDTNVLIELAKGSLPSKVLELFDTATIFQCSVCKAEIAVGLANRDVTDSRWKYEVSSWAAIFDSHPDNRMLNPDEDIWTRAGFVTGTITRIQGYQPQQMKELLNDSLIFLTAVKNGVSVLTKNKDDFDLIQQVVGKGKFYYFEMP